VAAITSRALQYFLNKIVLGQVVTLSIVAELAGEYSLQAGIAAGALRVKDAAIKPRRYIAT